MKSMLLLCFNVTTGVYSAHTKEQIQTIHVYFLQGRILLYISNASPVIDIYYAFESLGKKTTE